MLTLLALELNWDRGGGGATGLAHRTGGLPSRFALAVGIGASLQK
jgi:hypothetical protein